MTAVLTASVTTKDGREVPFRPGKIRAMLRAAGLAEPAGLIGAITAARPATTDDIFALVLAAVDNPGALIEYREQKVRARRHAVDPGHALTRLTDPKVTAENGNKDARTFTTQREIMAGAVAKSLGLQKLPAPVRKAHLGGLIHVHDLDRSPHQAMPNCSLPDFGYLLSHGFTLGNARIEPPKSIGVAATLLVQLLGAISGEQYGGISIHEIDRLLAPYAEMTLEKNKALYAEVGADESFALRKTVKDIFDAMQAFEYQVNTLTTAAAQTPFTSVSLGLGTSWCEREIQKAMFRVREEGMSGETAIFPKLLYFVDEGVNRAAGDPNYDIKQLAMRCARRRIYPDMVSAARIREVKSGQLITPMGCRSFLHPWGDEILGRNNLGVVSLNLPQIAVQAAGDEEDFFLGLDDAIDLAFSALKVREDVVLSAEPENAPIMYTQGGMGMIKDTVAEYYTGDNAKRSSISLGYIGIHNAMVALTGEEHWQEQAGHRALSLRILEHMNARVDAAQADFHAFVSVYATPSESLCDRFADIDRTRYGVIDGVNDRAYYENSFHFPSHRPTNPVDKIRFEADYMALTPGGFMFYVEAPNLLDNPEAFEAIWDIAYDHVGYFGINCPVDNCFDCGFEGEFTCDEHGYRCPGCGNRDETRASVTRRLCGYLGSPMKRPVVSGKQAEINARVKHA